MKKISSHKNSLAVTGKPPDVPQKARDAIRLMVETPGLGWDELAKKVGYSNARALRVALNLPQSLAWAKKHKARYLEQINLGNPASLRKVRDESENAMAKVAAVRALEGLEENERLAGRGSEGGGPRPTAGIVILISGKGVPPDDIRPSNIVQYRFEMTESEAAEYRRTHPNVAVEIETRPMVDVTPEEI